MVVSFGHVHHDPSSQNNTRNAKLTLRLRETNWSLKDLNFCFFFPLWEKACRMPGSYHFVVFPATAFTLQNAWATRTSDVNRKGEEHSGWRCECFRFSPNSKLTISMFQNPQQLQAIYVNWRKKKDMVIWWKDTPGQFVEKRTLQEGWRCSRFNRLTLPAIWHLGCMILRKLEILRKDPFARQWVTMTVTFSRSISRIVHSRINKRSNRNPNFYVSNTSLIRVRFWGQLC